MKRLRHHFAACGIVLITAASLAAQTDPPTPGYVGSQVCAGCHEGQAQSWQDSHHAWAWTIPDEVTIFGNFDNAVFDHRGVTTRFTHRDSAFFVEIRGPDGVMREYQILGVVGVAPLQQYIVETEPGRLQVLDVAWDVESARWYHLYPNDDLPPGNGLHWSGPYKNWNARCAECHATGYLKNYDARARRYQSQQAEIGVGCEACHGPGEAHVTWAEAPGSYDAERWPDLT